MKVHEAIARCLVDNGIHTLFGVIGDGNLFFVDSFKRLPGTRYVAAAGEDRWAGRDTTPVRPV